jgi:malate synthase
VLSPVKVPWYVDLLNLNLNNADLQVARERVSAYLQGFARDGSRLTDNPDSRPN